ncbi:MAG: hypothetical protein ABIB47_01900 [Candidatus Woesearchaeota archaeon]
MAYKCSKCGSTSEEAKECCGVPMGEVTKEAEETKEESTEEESAEEPKEETK